MNDEQTAVNARSDGRDFMLRLISVIGLVGVAFALLLAVQPA